MPLHWSQVRAQLDPNRLTVRTAPAQLRRQQPWKDYARAASSLRAVLKSRRGSFAGISLST